jgi:hypothetical protein
MGALIEAYALVKPEVARARARFEVTTAYGFLEALRMAAVRCGGGFDFERRTYEPSPMMNLKRPIGDGNTSSLKRYRWTEWRERPEHWWDVACRCPSF